MPISPYRLYDQPIEPQGRMSMSEQVYCILCEEIQSGRWQIGERLPGVLALANESGLSRAPIQQAFERLEREGWVRKEPRSGTYLESVLPHSHRPLGTIGVAIPEEGTQLDATKAVHLHALLKLAARRDFLTQVAYVPEAGDWSDVNLVGACFGPEVKGVIALHAFPYLEPAELPEDRIPLVMWGRPDAAGRSDCAPLVVHDTRYGFYLLTRRVLEAGHRRILFLGDAVLFDTIRELRLQGHRMAMEEAGAEFMEEAYRRSLEVESDNPLALADFLDAQAQSVTAIVCQRNIARQVALWAGRGGRRIPEDISVVGHFTEAVSHDDPSRFFTGIDYRLERTAEACFGILNDQIGNGGSAESLVVVKPRIAEGTTLAPPPDAPGVQAETGAMSASR